MKIFYGNLCVLNAKIFESIYLKSSLVLFVWMSPNERIFYCINSLWTSFTVWLVCNTQNCLVKCAKRFLASLSLNSVSVEVLFLLNILLSLYLVVCMQASDVSPICLPVHFYVLTTIYQYIYVFTSTFICAHHCSPVCLCARDSSTVRLCVHQYSTVCAHHCPPVYWQGAIYKFTDWLLGALIRWLHACIIQ